MLTLTDLICAAGMFAAAAWIIAAACIARQWRWDRRYRDRRRDDAE